MTRMTLSRVAALAVAVVVAAGAWWWFYGGAESAPFDKAPSVDGSVVRLTYTGSECETRAWVDVEESAARVVLTVRTVEHSLSCSDVGVVRTLEATLDEPLGERELVDGACLNEPWASRPACAS